MAIKKAKATAKKTTKATAKKTTKAKPVTERSVEFYSCWDGDTVIYSDAMLNLITGEVFDIETSDVRGLDCLDEQGIFCLDGQYLVFEGDEIGPKLKKAGLDFNPKAYSSGSYYILPSDLEKIKSTL